MIQARPIFALLILLGAAAAAVAQSPAPADVNVVPRPVSLKTLNGTFLLTSETRILAGDDESRRVAELFNDYLLGQHGLRLKVVGTRPRGENSISFSQSGSRDLPDEGYRLRIEPKVIRVTGKPAGLFYGMQTLTQLLPLDLVPTIELPAVEITDAPRFGYRGLLLDVGRHFYSVEFLKKLLDVAAQYKINRFHWHLTDDQGWRIEIKRYPKLTQGKSLNPDDPAYVAYYTQDQIREIVAYARARFITVIPEIEMPGHSGAARAAYPELGCAPVESAVAFCPKAETFVFLENVLSEVIELFPSPYIHIGGDEVEKEGWRQSAEAQAILKREGLKDEDELQSYFLRHIERFLTSKHRRMIGWDEILQGGLAPNAIVMSWRGEEGGVEAVRQKHPAIMTPTDYCYFDYNQGDRNREPVSIGGYVPLAKVYGYEPVPKELSADDARQIIGAQANLWTEYIATPEHVEYMVFPRLLALSEAVWSPAAGKDYEDFKRRLRYQLGRLDKQDVRYRIPEPDGLEDFYTTTADRTTVALTSMVAGSSIHYTLDGSDPTDASPRYEAPLQIPLPMEQKTTLNVLVTAPVGRRSAVYSAHFLRRPYREAIAGVSPEPGLSFALVDGTFTTVRDIKSGTPVASGTTSALDLEQFGRTSKFGVRFDGYVKVETDSFYRFAVESDDGSVLSIDDEVVIENDGNHAPQLVTGHIPLRQGFHKISLWYYQSEGGAAFRVDWAAAGGELQPLAGPALFH
ncbi:MAG TPA: family 20 glycosylhydrolase [Steroidobacteraceae bacterium]|nr:family 20 glycosylhydrolase [Steroidobacteraceae bacterium]